MKSTSLVLLIALIVSYPFGCTSVKTYPVSEPGRDPSEYVHQSPQAMVTTAHPAATFAGLSMLKQGGNAIDAATAISFALSVVRPQSTGIGGGGFMLYYNKGKDQVVAYDFRERAPASATKAMFLDEKGTPKDFIYEGHVLPNASQNGHLAAGVPGLVKGLVETHAKHGKLPLKVVMAPAIKLAKDGFEIYTHLADSISRRAKVLAAFPDSRRIFLKPSGEPRKAGEKLVQDELAGTLTLISELGVRGFYEGVTAQKIVQEMKRGKGLISLNDLKQYTVKERQPVIGTYRGYKIASMPPPSSGGVHIIQMLNMLEPFNFDKLDHNSPEAVHLITEVMRRAFADRANFLGDPDFVKIPIKGLISKAYAKKRMSNFSDQHASSSTKLGAGNPIGYESDSTTHFSVVDQLGNAVSSTQTINGGFGSGVVVQGTGIVLNNEMDDFSIKPGVPNLFGLVGNEANAIAARKTMLSSMSPTLVFDNLGRLDLVVGSPGGPRIINATLQVIINHIDFKLPLDKAVMAYRFHHQWLPDVLFIEADGFSESDLKTLKELGHSVEVRGTVGLVQAIARSGRKGWIGVADSRDNGYAAGF